MTSFLYNPDRKPKSELIAEFVIRTQIYSDIMRDLETSYMKQPEQHYLLVGQRGSGKTTLLNRLKYGIEDSHVLQKNVIPILFSEEQYNISELVNLWENIGQQLEDYHGFIGLYEQMESFISSKNFEEQSYDLLKKRLQAENKKLVLLIDNIGDMLNKMDKKEIRRLRSILQTDSEMRLIVGSPYYLEDVLDYQQPLFEFFKVIRLDSLNQKETQALLLKLAVLNNEEAKITKIITETPDRIETLRTLTGGVPRTIALMYTIFIEFNHEDSVKDLEKILDAVTPLYKHRMDDLPTQQQKIVDVVAKNWDGISVKELKERLRIDGKIISAQLGQLQKNQIIEAVDSGTKNNIYFLKERFFNIWYLMRYGRKYDQQRVVWLVKFLESWCSMVDIELRIVDYSKKIKDGILGEQLINFYGEVYTAMTKKMRSETKVLLKESAPVYLSRQIMIEDAELFRMGAVEFENINYPKAFELFWQLHKPDNNTTFQVISYIFKLPQNDYDYFYSLMNKMSLKFDDGKQGLEINYIEQLLFFVIFIFACVTRLSRGEHVEAHSSLDSMLGFTDHEWDVDQTIINLLIETALIHFLQFHQYNTILECFEKFPTWKHRVSPVYYSTLKMLDRDTELKKMPPEISDAVDRIINQVAELQTSFSEIKK